jgi:galactofuranose transport system permease protein
MSEDRKRTLRDRARSHPLLWPVVTLALILMVNASLNQGFWILQWRDGHLYGSVIDILNRAARWGRWWPSVHRWPR